MPNKTIEPTNGATDPNSHRWVDPRTDPSPQETAIPPRVTDEPSEVTELIAWVPRSQLHSYWLVNVATIGTHERIVDFERSKQFNNCERGT